MLKKFSYFIFLVLFILNKTFFFIFKRNFLGWLLFFITNNSYTYFNILKKKIKFFSPNYLIEWRVRTIFDKEPETIDWINNFTINKNNKTIFWDIGANIGLYSLYAAIKFKKKIKIYAFEPSTSNLRILSRNISVNNLQSNIIINPIALSNKENKFLTMNEMGFEEGMSLNTCGQSYNFEGKKMNIKNSYKTFSTNIDSLIKNKIIEIPSYIKIDVDGIEHLILQGGKQLFSTKKVKSILIEINENFKDQYLNVIKFMEKNKYVLKKKINHEEFNKKNKFSKTYNYFFEKK
jgi:FkbM family methyltransferase